MFVLLELILRIVGWCDKGLKGVWIVLLIVVVLVFCFGVFKILFLIGICILILFESEFLRLCCDNGLEGIFILSLYLLLLVVFLYCWVDVSFVVFCICVGL